MVMSPIHHVFPKPSCKAQWKGEEDKADRGRVGKTTSGNGQAWSSASPRGQWRTGKNGKAGCKTICGAPTTLAVKALMMLMIMMMKAAGERGDRSSQHVMLYYKAFLVLAPFISSVQIHCAHMWGEVQVNKHCIPNLLSINPVLCYCLNCMWNKWSILWLWAMYTHEKESEQCVELKKKKDVPLSVFAPTQAI